MRSDTARAVVRHTAPVTIGGVGLLVLVVALAGFWSINVLLGMLFSVVAPWLEVLGSFAGLFLPLAFAFGVFRAVSRWLYARERVGRRALMHHVWHCALLYVAFAWIVANIASCSGVGPIPLGIPPGCDPFGVTVFVGFVTLAGIIGDAVAAREVTRTP